MWGAIGGGFIKSLDSISTCACGFEACAIGFRVIYPWWSLPTITAIMLASGWLHMRLCMGGSADHLFAGKKLEKGPWQGLR